MSIAPTFPRAAPAARASEVLLERAILRTLAYADVFDYPLTLDEIHRFLVGQRAGRWSVESLLVSSRRLRRLVWQCDGCFTLAGREDTVAVRRRRAAVAGRLWSEARRYGRAIAALPFVRMVAVTGSLAMDNTDHDGDVDFLMVTEPGRVWLCHTMALAVVRAAALRGVRLCPNFVLSTRALELPARSLYVAHELVQMVPLSGGEVYVRLCDANPWVSEFLPNAGWAATTPLPGAGPRALRGIAEAVFRTRVGDWLEGSEQRRKRRKAMRQRGEPGEAVFTPDVFKNHQAGMARRILETYEERVRALEVKLE